MIKRPAFVLPTVAAAVVALLFLAATTIRAEPHRASFRSLFHQHAHAHRSRCHQAELFQSPADDEDDEGLADDDAPLHVSVAVTPFTVVDPPTTILSKVHDSAPASEYSDTGVPRAPPRSVLA